MNYFLLRSNAFESATQFTDQYSAAFYPDPDTDYAAGDQVLISIINL